MAIQYVGTSISGLAGDTKPTPSGNEKGLLFIETDTNKTYQWDTDSWNEIIPTSAPLLTTARTIGGTSFNGSANIVPGTITVTDNESTNEGNLITFVAGAATSTGSHGLEMDGNFTYNPSSGTVTATAFAGNLTGTLQTAAQTTITSVGALDGGSITSNFGAINVGSSAITTTGTITAGNLSVTGTTTTVHSTNTTISDRLIELATGAGDSTADAGIIIERGSTGDNAVIAWDESADSWTVGTTTATGSSTGNLSITAGPFVASTLTGTLQTAAQTNITSLGTLTNLQVDNININANTIKTSSAIFYIGTSATDMDVQFYGGTSGRDMTWDAGGNMLVFKDNAQLFFGTGTDLAIYHDGSNSFITEQGTGALYITASRTYFRDSANSNNHLIDLNANTVYLKHAGNTKLATTSTGVDITGALTTSSHIYLPDSQMLMLGTSQDLRISIEGHIMVCAISTEKDIAIICGKESVACSSNLSISGVRPVSFLHLEQAVCRCISLTK